MLVSVGGSTMSRKKVTNEELFNALMTIKDLCDSRETCIGCPLAKRGKTVADDVMWQCRVSAYSSPRDWILIEPENYSPFED